MRKMFLFISMFLMPHLSSAALSPAVYAHAKSHASEVMVIKTGRVVKYRLKGNRILVKAKARVLYKYKSANQNKRVRWITIRYITHGKRSRKLLGPAPIQILRANQIYKAYLNRSTRGRYYVPAAGNRSFVSRRPHRRRRIHPRKRLF